MREQHNFGIAEGPIFRWAVKDVPFFLPATLVAGLRLAISGGIEEVFGALAEAGTHGIVEKVFAAGFKVFAGLDEVVGVAALPDFEF